MKTPKPKRIDFEILPQGHDAYKLLRQVRRKYHEHLKGAGILLAFKKHWKRNKDGVLKLGKLVKASALQRELATWDFAILLNQELWEAKEIKDKWRIALLDHELCHAMPALDKNGNQRTDEKGRLVWRTRGHDIEEFRSVVEHHGCYKSDLAAFAKALKQKKDLPLLESLVSEQPTAVH